MSNDFKATLTLGVVFALTVATVIWVTGGRDVHAAVVSGVFTILAAAGAAYIAFWQLRRQLENAAANNLHAEKLKLKKQIYEEMADAIREALDAARAMERYIVGSYREAWQHKELYINDVYDMAPPVEHRYTEVVDRETALFEKVNEIVRLLSRWEVIDPRIRLFKMAMSAALHEVRESMKTYNRRTLGVLPLDDASHENVGWKPPSEKTLEELSDTTDILRVGIDYVRYWVLDLQSAMQTALLGELFNTRVKPRMEQPDHPARVLTLEDEEELVRYLLEETSWGKSIAPYIVKSAISNP